jgi:nitroreductase
VNDFADVVRGRRMTRAFTSEPIAAEQLDRLVDLASRAPSAGKTQGWHLVVLEGAETARYWDITLPADRRASFRWKRLLDAPVLMIVVADPDAYVERYAEPDKAATGLGAGVESWPAPYWTIDASMAVMTLLLAAENDGLGALFFGVFQRELEVRAELAIPDDFQIIGAIALGHGHRTVDEGRGASARRPRRSPDEIIHRNRFS